jgi:uroporphyrinogen decarboxylase
MNSRITPNPNAFTGPLYAAPGVSTLTPRERYRRVTHFQVADHPVHMEFGWWNETFPLWHEQGLPAHVTNSGEGDRFFGLDTTLHVPVDVGMHPDFAYEVLEKHDRYNIVRDGEGVICQVFTDGSSSIPHYLKFPIETREDWERFRDERLDPTVPRHRDLEARAAALNAADRPVGLSVGSMWGRIRDWMGFENACMAVADDPEWMDEMMDHLVSLTLTTIDKATRLVNIDFAYYWEDMAYNAGPMVSPTFFRDHLTPHYTRVTDFLRRRGVDVVWVDCDGDANLLVPGWLDGGVNGMFPLERAGHMFPDEVREQYGERVLLFGGVDKRAMIAGRDAIERELTYLAPVVAQSGFIPFCDHRCPPDVTYANYLYYLKRKCEVFGIPKPIDYDGMLVEADDRAKHAAKA